MLYPMFIIYNYYLIYLYLYVFKRFLTYTFSHLTFLCFYVYKCDFSYICKFCHNCVLCSSRLKLKLFFRKRRKSSKYYLVPCRCYKTSHNVKCLHEVVRRIFGAQRGMSYERPGYCLADLL